MAATSDMGEDRLRTADLLGALSIAADLAVGLPAEHALRSCYMGMRIAEQLGLPPAQRADLYYAELLMDVGCTAWTSQVAGSLLGDEILARRELFFETEVTDPRAVFGWLLKYMAPAAPLPARAQRILRFAMHGKDFMREGFRNTCAVAERFAARLGMSTEVQRALACVFEQWDGSGPRGSQGEDIPFISRVVYASSFLEVFHRLGGREAAERLALKRKATAFDPLVVDTFLAVARGDEFWAPLDRETIWDTALGMEPDSDYRYIPADRIPDVALSFADFADLKSPHLAGHSRRVAELAQRIAARLGLPENEIASIQMAALVHDLGLVAVPSFTLEKPPDHLSKAEQEALRLHPYHGERILARIPTLRPVAELVSAHHERLDGSGYYRGLTGADVPIGARIIAVADVFEELTHDSPGQSEMAADAAIRTMSGENGGGFDQSVLRTLAEEIGAPVSFPAAPDTGDARRWPAGLTEREVQVLRLLAKGKGRRDIAAELVLSEGTVRSHLEHIYTKIEVSTQVAAVLFAIEHGILE